MACKTITGDCSLGPLTGFKNRVHVLGGAQNQNEVHAAFGTRIEDIKKLISCECSLQRILVLAVSAATVV